MMRKIMMILVLMTNGAWAIEPHADHAELISKINNALQRPQFRSMVQQGIFFEMGDAVFEGDIVHLKIHIMPRYTATDEQGQPVVHRTTMWSDGYFYMRYNIATDELESEPMSWIRASWTR